MKKAIGWCGVSLIVASSVLAIIWGYKAHSIVHSIVYFRTLTPHEASPDEIPDEYNAKITIFEKKFGNLSIDEKLFLAELLMEIQNGTIKEAIAEEVFAVYLDKVREKNGGIDFEPDPRELDTYSMGQYAPYSVGQYLKDISPRLEGKLFLVGIEIFAIPLVVLFAIVYAIFTLRRRRLIEKNS